MHGAPPSSPPSIFDGAPTPLFVNWQRRGAAPTSDHPFFAFAAPPSSAPIQYSTSDTKNPTEKFSPSSDLLKQNPFTQAHISTKKSTALSNSNSWVKNILLRTDTTFPWSIRKHWTFLQLKVDWLVTKRALVALLKAMLLDVFLKGAPINHNLLNPERSHSFQHQKIIIVPSSRRPSKYQEISKCRDHVQSRRGGHLSTCTTTRQLSQYRSSPSGTPGDL